MGCTPGIRKKKEREEKREKEETFRTLGTLRHDLLDGGGNKLARSSSSSKGAGEALAQGTRP